MAFVYKDNVRESTITTGVGTLTLGGASGNSLTFAAAIGLGNSCCYRVGADGAAEWEVGIGTVGSGTLTRATVLSSSNAGALVSFSAGSKVVFCTFPAFAAAAYVGTAPPSPALDGHFWWDSTTGTLKIYYNDGNTSQWVDAFSGMAGTAPTGMTRIAKVVTSGSATTITFGNIPQTFTDLKIVFQGRDTAGSSQDLRVKVNSDATAGNYTSTEYQAGSAATVVAGTVASSAAGGRIGLLPGPTQLATAVADIEITIPNYNGTAFHKNVRSIGTAYYSATPLVDHWLHGFVWKSAAPITDLVLTTSGTAFADGATATLYGLGGSDTTIASGGTPSGTAFPTSPAPTPGQQFFRTDLGYECYYDGVRWLTKHEYPLTFEMTDTSKTMYLSANLAAGYFLAGVDLRQAGMWITDIVMCSVVATTNSGSIFWTVQFGSISAAGAFTNLGAAFSTSADVVNQQSVHRVAVNQALTAAQMALTMTATKTSTPGGFYIFPCTVYYKLIVT